MNSYEVKKCELIEEDGQFYLSITCLCENERQIREIVIPRVTLPLNRHTPMNVTGENSYARIWPYENVSLHLEDHNFKLKPVGGKYFTETVIKEKTQELTLEEIEKRLGYKVKIVSGGKK